MTIYEKMNARKEQRKQAVLNRRANGHRLVEFNNRKNLHESIQAVIDCLGVDKNLDQQTDKAMFDYYSQFESRKI